MKKKISASMVLAAIMLLVSMTALAMSNLNLFRSMTDMTAPIQPLSGAENMIETNLGSVENDYVTLTVEEAIYDGQSVMTLVHITPKDIGEYAMLNTFLQDIPDDLYITESRPVEVIEEKLELEIDGSVYVIINEPKRKVVTVDGEEVAIPHDLNTAMDMGYDRNTFESLPETISIRISSSITVNGQEIPLDDLTFDLSKSDSVSRISLIPVGGEIGENVVIHSGEISFTKLRGNLIVEYTYETSAEDAMLST